MSDGLQEADEVVSNIARSAGGVASAGIRTTKTLVSSGLQKTGSFLARHWQKRKFAKSIPQIFRTAMVDGQFTEKEEGALRQQFHEHGIQWDRAVKEITPEAREFVRRVMADIVADGEVSDREREEVERYIRVFHLDDMRDEIDRILNRVETLWKLSNGVLPSPLHDKPLWLRSDEALYFGAPADYLAENRQGDERGIAGTLFVTNSRSEFISREATFSHPHEQLRECNAVRRTHLSLLFNPKQGSGIYLMGDAPMASAYMHALTLSANRTATIVREDDTTDCRRRIPREVKHEVWIRDRGACAECQAQDYLEFDHVIPVSRGGSNSAANIQLLCRRCNGKKSDKL